MNAAYPFDRVRDADYYSYASPHDGGGQLKTVQMTLDDELVKEVVQIRSTG